MDHITCNECTHRRGDQCALTMERKPLGRIRGDQWCERASVVAAPADPRIDEPTALEVNAPEVSE